MFQGGPSPIPETSVRSWWELGPENKLKKMTISMGELLPNLGFQCHRLGLVDMFCGETPEGIIICLIFWQMRTSFQTKKSATYGTTFWPYNTAEQQRKQCKAVVVKINDPNTPERHQEQLQTIAASIRDLLPVIRHQSWAVWAQRSETRERESMIRCGGLTKLNSWQNSERNAFRFGHSCIWFLANLCASNRATWLIMKHKSLALWSPREWFCWHSNHKGAILKFKRFGEIWQSRLCNIKSLAI